MADCAVWSLKTGASNVKLVIALPYSDESDDSEEEISKEIKIDNLVKFRIKRQAKLFDGRPGMTYQYSLSKCDIDNNDMIKATVASEELKYFETDIHTPRDWSEWKLMGTQKKLSVQSKNKEPWPWTFLTHISFTIYKEKIDKITSKLYTDTEFIDFHLSTPEGSVAVHKVCLAAHSDVFKTMLKGEWKETANAQVKIKGVTMDTLNQLKEYLYLGTLPKGDLRPLLLIAKCYDIKDLQKHCIRKLAETVTSKNLFPLIDFACKHDIPELPFALLKLTQENVVQDAHLIKERLEKQQMLK